MSSQFPDGKCQQVRGDGNGLPKVKHLGAAAVLGLFATVHLLLFSGKGRHDRRGPRGDGNGGIVGELGPGQILAGNETPCVDGLALGEQIRMDLAGGLGRWEPLGGGALDRIRRRGVGDGHLALVGLGGRGQRNHQSAAEMVLALVPKRRSTS